jgi:tetratricopeptide (TPR) repeat protein
MKNKPNYSELVQKYLDNEMSKDEINLFESEIEQNKSLQKELNFHKKLNEVLSDEELEDFKVGLDKIHKEIAGGNGRKRRLYSRRWSLIAASILILITFGLVYVCERNVWSQDEKVFNQYYSRYISQNIVRSHTITTSCDAYIDALKLYDSEAYEKAELAFQSVIDAKPENIAAKFYLGIVNIELKELQIATLLFDQVIETGDQFYMEHSQWYKSLSLVAMGNNVEAIKQLKIISTENGFYKARADEIILQLQ